MGNGPQAGQSVGTIDRLGDVRCCRSEWAVRLHSIFVFCFWISHSLNRHNRTHPRSRMEKMESNSFFDTYKELFEYEKYVGTEDPVSMSQRDGIGAKTFLDRYKECDQRQAMELRVAFQTPLVSNLMAGALMTTSGLPIRFTPFAFSSPTAAIPQQPEMAPPSKAPAPSFTRSRLENSLRQSLSNQEDAAALWPHFTQPSAGRESPRHDGNCASPPKVASSLLDHTKPQASLLPGTLDASSRPHGVAGPSSSPSQHTEFQTPKLSDLLIDSSTRAMTLRYKHLDETKKIELLIGNNCGGRISTVSSNLPPSIRRRLQSSAKVDQRRELLYSVLRQDHATLCGLR